MGLMELYVGEDDFERLDYYLSKELDEISRTYIKSLIKDKKIKVKKVNNLRYKN